VSCGNFSYTENVPLRREQRVPERTIDSLHLYSYFERWERPLL
jgi:hypothetical protein